MTRRQFLSRGAVLGAAGLLSGCRLARMPWEPTSGEPKTPLVAFVSASPLAPEAVYAGFLEGLQDLGYVDGSDISIPYHDVEGRPELVPDLTTELVRREVRVIVVAPASMATAIRQTNERVPVVIAYGDPVANGLVDSLVRPGRFTTGLTAATAVLSGKRLQLLRDILPGISRVAVVGTRSGGSDQFLRETEDAARSLSLQLETFRLGDPSELRAAFERMRDERDDALVITPGTFLGSAGGKAVADLAIEFRIPSVFESRVNALAGGLLSYGPNLADLARRSAAYVDRILKGANAGELPIEQPSKFDFVVNLQTAQILGLRIPDSVIAQATEVIF